MSKTILLQPFSLEKDETAKVKSFQDFSPCIKEAFEVSLKKRCMILGRYGNPLTWEILNFFKEALRWRFTWLLKRIFTVYCFPPCFPFWSKATVMQLSTPISYLISWKLLYEGNNNFLTSKNFIYENGTQIQFLSIIINEQEKFGSLGMKSEGKWTSTYSGRLFGKRRVVLWWMRFPSVLCAEL